MARRICDLENLVNEEAIARDWAAAPHKNKIGLDVNVLQIHVHRC
jgi:hypothetical protein